MANSTRGNKLITEIASNTGLPETLMTQELDRLVESAGLESNIVSLDDLRRVLAEYAQEVLMQVKEEQDLLRQA